MFNFFLELKKHFKLNDSHFASFQMINLSNKFLYIENHKGIMNFTNEMISFKVKTGVMVVHGKNLFLKEISSNTISISGDISSFEVF